MFRASASIAVLSKSHCHGWRRLQTLVLATFLENATSRIKSYLSSKKDCWMYT